MWLTDEEVEGLTRRRKYGAQCKALRAMGIDFWVRGDGSPAVLRSIVDKTSAGATVIKEYAFGPIKRATSTQP